MRTSVNSINRCTHYTSTKDEYGMCYSDTGALILFAESDTQYPCKIPTDIWHVPKQSAKSVTYTRTRVDITLAIQKMDT